MFLLHSLAFASFLFVVYRIVAGKSRRARSRLPLPPGPKRLPIIGNLLDIPTSFQWETFHKWCRDLNTDIMYLNVAGQNIIVLDSAEAVNDLLEKRGGLYAGRPPLTMVTELMGWSFHFVFMGAGTLWRQCRRIMHQEFNTNAMVSFQPHMLRASRNLLNKFLESPDVLPNLKHTTGEVIMSILYGIETKPHNDPYLAIADDAAEVFLQASVPGTYLVDNIPWLKHVPEWMPGADFKRKAREWKKLTQKMVQRPFDTARKNVADHTSITCFISKSLRHMEVGAAETKDAYSPELIKNVAGSIYIAAIDTTVSAIANGILGLLERPDVMQRAHEELDRVLQPGHLPDFHDQPSLPFITAIAKEALRWRCVGPMAVPHVLDQEVDDEYRGYRIPAGAIVIGNAWALLRDETAYPEPLKFKPERFMKGDSLDPTVRDPDHAAFGYGRRVCPGKSMAFSLVWITLASMIRAFDIEKAKDKDGNVIEPTNEYPNALVCVPKPFECSIKPRSEEMVSIIRAHLNQEIS